MPLITLQRLVPRLTRVTRQLRDPSPGRGGETPRQGELALQPADPVPDCDALIDSVKSSLWGLIDAPVDTDPQGAARDAAGRVRSAALQGALALEELQSRLSREFADRDRLLREIDDARAALEQARAELAGTRMQAQQARYQASHDPLTRLPNRAHFLERLQDRLADAAPGGSGEGMAVLFLDLDGFKPVNDTHGHAAGDALLQVVASRLTRAVRADDTVGRLGGDEFACLLPGLADVTRASALGRKLRDAIRMPCRIGPTLVQVDASIGLALCPEDGQSAEDLLLKADMAMYRAKRTGAGLAWYGDELAR